MSGGSTNRIHTKEGRNFSAEQANKDKTVYLIDDREAENLEEYISLNYAALFENELEGWYTDETLWPENRDLELFKKWFEVECHTMLIDTGTGPIIDDESWG